VLRQMPDAAIVGPRLLNGDGSAQASARTFPTLSNALARRTIWRVTPWGRRALAEHLAPPCGDHEDWVAVDWLLGAAMLIRGEALQALGGFDSRYFLYCEDADFCARAWRQGYTVLYCPDVVFKHEYQRASRRTLDLTSRATRAHLRSTVRLAASYPRQYFGGRFQRGSGLTGTNCDPQAK
jgi:N-acetylglucosaminyl-diphospho-decaprenol L-rhamnosyltransferase